MTLRRVQRGVDLSGVLPGLLKEKKLTQASFADLIGAPRTDVNAWCNGRRRVGDRWLPIIAKALKVSERSLRGAPPDSEVAIANARVAHLLERLEAEADDAAMTLVAEVLRLLARRLDAAELQLARRGSRSRRAQ